MVPVCFLPKHLPGLNLGRTVHVNGLLRLHRAVFKTLIVGFNYLLG